MVLKKMKQIFESEQTFQAYAAIDFGYWRIEQIKLEMEKPVSPINQMIDAATGFDKAQRTDWTAEAIDNRRGLFARRGIFREIEREIMSEKIKRFLYPNAKAAVEFEPERAVRFLVDLLGYERKQNFVDGEIYSIDGKNWYLITSILNSFDAVHRTELAIIEKVGADIYGRTLRDLMATGMPEFEDGFVARVATADAPTKVAAMLVALSG